MGLNEQLSKIQKDLKDIKGEEEKEKKKLFKIPFGKKVSNGQAKKNYVTLIKINDNGILAFEKERIEEQTIMVDGVPRLATNDHVLFYKNKPFMILPSWSVEPFSPRQHLANSLANNSNIKGYQLLLNRMKLSGVEGAKKGMNSMVAWIIGLGLAGIIGYALYTGGI